MATPIITGANVAAAAYHVYMKENGSADSGDNAGFDFVGEIDPDGIRISRTINGEEITVNSFGDDMPVDYITKGEKYELGLILMEINRKNAIKLAFSHLDIEGNNPADLALGGADVADDMGVTRLPGLLASAAHGFALKLAPVTSAAPAMDSNYETASGDRIRFYPCMVPKYNEATRIALRMGMQRIPVALTALPYLGDAGAGTNNVYRFWEYTDTINT